MGGGGGGILLGLWDPTTKDPSAPPPLAKSHPSLYHRYYNEWMILMIQVCLDQIFVLGKLTLSFLILQ